MEIRFDIINGWFENDKYLWYEQNTRKSKIHRFFG